MHLMFHIIPGFSPLKLNLGGFKIITSDKLQTVLYLLLGKRKRTNYFQSEKTLTICRILAYKVIILI